MIWFILSKQHNFIILRRIEFMGVSAIPTIVLPMSVTSFSVFFLN